MGAAYAAVEPASESPEQPFYHESILLDEVVQFLQPVAGKLMADGTLGGGGHTEALLKAVDGSSTFMGSCCPILSPWKANIRLSRVDCACAMGRLYRVVRWRVTILPGSVTGAADCRI